MYTFLFFFFFSYFIGFYRYNSSGTHYKSRGKKAKKTVNIFKKKRNSAYLFKYFGSIFRENLYNLHQTVGCMIFPIVLCVFVAKDVASGRCYFLSMRILKSYQNLLVELIAWDYLRSRGSWAQCRDRWIDRPPAGLGQAKRYYQCIHSVY